MRSDFELAWNLSHILLPSSVAATNATISLFASPKHKTTQADRFANMSRNVSALDQEQAVAAHSMPVFGSPPRCPPIPHFTNLAYLMQLPDPPPLPQLAASLKPKKARQQLTAIHAKYGFVAAASVAAQYHNAGNPGIAEPYTTEELIVRDLYARQHLGGVFSTYHQDAENAVVLRLLIPRAGQKLPFELDAT